MSDFQVEGVDIELNGETRNFLFDFGVIEHVQEKYGAHPIMAIQNMFWADKDANGNEFSHYRASTVIDLTYFLLNAEVSRRKFYDGSTDLRKYTRDEVGHIITRKNADAVVGAITQAWTGSVPAPEEDDLEEDEETDTESKKKKQKT